MSKSVTVAWNNPDGIRMKTRRKMNEYGKDKIIPRKLNTTKLERKGSSAIWLSPMMAVRFLKAHLLHAQSFGKIESFNVFRYKVVRRKHSAFKLQKPTEEENDLVKDVVFPTFI